MKEKEIGCLKVNKLGSKLLRGLRHKIGLIFTYLQSLCFRCCYCLVAQSCPTLCNPMDCSTPGLPVPPHLPEFAQIHVHCISDAIQPSHPLTPSSSALNLSQHQGFFSMSHLFTSDDQKYWSFSISPSSEYSALISLKIDLFHPLAVQVTFRSLLQHHSSKASIIWHSVFFTVQLSQLL